MAIDSADHVWSADITDIRLRQGFVYVVAIMDWYSRYVLAWEVSVTLDTSFCLAALERALRGTKPTIFNTDQGGQFTSQAFTGRLLADGVHISMDGRGRAFDNIMIERLWRTVKWEHVFLREHRTIADLRAGFEEYFDYYNYRRWHSALENQPPAAVYQR